MGKYFLKAIPDKFYDMVESGQLKVCGNLIKDLHGKIVGQLEKMPTDQLMDSIAQEKLQTALVKNKLADLQAQGNQILLNLNNVNSTLQDIQSVQLQLSSSLGAITSLTSISVALSAAGIVATCVSTAIICQKIDEQFAKTCKAIEQLGAQIQEQINKNTARDENSNMKTAFDDCLKHIRNCEDYLHNPDISRSEVEREINELCYSLKHVTHLFKDYPISNWDNQNESDISPLGIVNTINGTYNYLARFVLYHQQQIMLNTKNGGYDGAVHLKEVYETLSSNEIWKKIVKIVSLYAPSLISDSEIATFISMYLLNVQNGYENLESSYELLSHSDEEQRRELLEQIKQEENPSGLFLVTENEDAFNSLFNAA